MLRVNLIGPRLLWHYMIMCTIESLTSYQVHCKVAKFVYQISNFVLSYWWNYSVNYLYNLKGMKITYTFAKRVVMVANSYLDFVSDTILLSAILNSLEYSLEPTKFASQVGLILLVSLIFPLLLSAITIAYKKPLVIVNYFIWSHFKETASAKKNKLILVCRIIIILFFPMVPALILCQPVYKWIW